ncbi:MAG: hypothetical protein IH595_12470 [Bacteroidales bacterium]|nr:hypothetical protein [Bacteroidales bacterium]
MKPLFYVSAIFLFLLCSCHRETKPAGQKVTFGIHEIAKVNTIPAAILDTLRSKGVQLENSQSQFIIGYITKDDSMALKSDFSAQYLKIVKTYYPVDEDQKYYAIVAISPNAVINNNNISKAEADGNNVTLYFNFTGSKKWADLTKKNIGNQLAFVIDNQIYSMPLINGEIRNGMAIISGFKSNKTARKVSEDLNFSREK